MECEFWGIEVKPGQTIKCEPGDKTLHLSQASLGETKQDKISENALLFLKANDQKLVIGTLCADKCAQINYNLVFEKDFELSHSSKNYSVYFCGYKATVDENDHSDSSDSDSDSDSKDEDIQHDLQSKGKPLVKEAQMKPESLLPESAKGSDSLAEPKPKAVEPNKAYEDGDGYSEDVTDSEDDNDDEDTSSDGDEATPKKAGVGEKRPAGSPSKTPVPAKKANQKTDGDGGKKESDPTKDKGKAPANDDEPKQRIVYSTCKACNRKFNSGKVLDSHSKAMHANEK